ncbi:unnamed protein product [Clavelina lepadiformis]|uniref:Sugar phosphate transporter domain-containing protein n=1 Tax=Clavelina lepadiformis TaxID=159417 RepID=A0ABP0GZS9_CLALP
MTSKNPTTSFMLFSIFFYGICSCSMNFINKFVLTSWSFNQPAILLLGQLPLLSLVLRVLKASGKIELVTYDLKTAKSCALLSVLYCANSVIALVALSGMNVPMYNALRRCIPLASMLLGYFVFTKRPTFNIFMSIIVITIGAAVAASGDLNFHLKSYAMGITSAILMSLQLIVLQYNGTEKHLTSLDLLYVNSINCIPIVFTLSLGTFTDVLNYPHWTDIGFLFSFFLVVISGCVLNYSMFLCTTINSALTTTCVGAIKSGFTTLIGIFAFGDVTPTAPFLVGQAINFGGGLMYAYAKFQHTRSIKENTQQLQNVKVVKT